jgi:hypothetical protein
MASDCHVVIAGVALYMPLGTLAVTICYPCAMLSTLSNLRALNLSMNILGTEGSRYLGEGRLCTTQACLKLAGYLLI